MALNKVDTSPKIVDEVVEKFVDTGSFKLDSSVFSGFAAEEANRKQEVAPVQEQVKTITKEDGTIVTEEDISGTNDILFKDIPSANDKMTEKLAIEDILKPVEISPIEKEKFLDAVITGDRYTQSKTIFNGRISIVFRSRQAKETTAIYSYVGRAYSAGVVSNDLESAELLKRHLLICQLQELNGIEFKPYLDYKKSGGDTKEWDELLQFITDLDSGIFEALFKQLIAFETKYWTMVNNADDQNFWNPADVT